MSTNHLSVSPQLSVTHRARTRAPAAVPRSVPVAQASRAPGVKKSFPSRSTTSLAPLPPSSPLQAPSGEGPAWQGGMPPCEGLKCPSHGMSQLCKSNPGPSRVLHQTHRQLTPCSIGPQRPGWVMRLGSSTPDGGSCPDCGSRGKGVRPCCPSKGLSLAPTLCYCPQAHAGMGLASGGPIVKNCEAQQFALVQLMSSVSGSSRVDRGVGVKSLPKEDVFRAVCPIGIHGRVHRYEVCY